MLQLDSSASNGVCGCSPFTDGVLGFLCKVKNVIIFDVTEVMVSGQRSEMLQITFMVMLCISLPQLALVRGHNSTLI